MFEVLCSLLNGVNTTPTWVERKVNMAAEATTPLTPLVPLES